MRVAAVRLSLLVAGILLVAACASSPRSQEERYLHAIEDANKLYEATLIEAGRSHATGLLTNEQLAGVRKAGKLVESALKAARASLEAWLMLKQDDSQLALDIASLQRVLADLIVVASAGRNGGEQ